jgi:hypothetical protein
MKKSMYLILLCLSVIISSCSSDDNNDTDNGDNNNDNNNNTTEEYFRAKVDGADFIASTDPASLIGATVSTNSGMTVAAAQGSTNNGDFINLSIVNYNGPGTYTTGDSMTNPNMIMYGTLPANVWASNFASFLAGINPGQINITSDSDGILEGTFSFQGYNADDMTTKNITQGNFKAMID